MCLVYALVLCVSRVTRRQPQAIPAVWANVIGTVFAFFDSVAPQLGLPAQRALFEFLIVLPEEFRSASLSSERRAAVFGELLEGKTRVRLLDACGPTNGACAPHVAVLLPVSLSCISSLSCSVLLYACVEL
jgi:hypothetical protein